MRSFFAYIRVSTARQGERGVSLQEQRDSIENYAKRHGLNIAEWFEERETAAKRGRAVFARMMRLLQKGKVEGVIIHKIDRSARNLRDWAELGELIDRGVTVHFANENLDLYTRGGRLSADIQAVVAADYIRNLREEVKKGFYGRLKQGLYPLPAPLGYLDCGSGNAKSLDPENASLVKKVFESYATGETNLIDLGEAADRMGLRTKRGGRLSVSSLADMLANPFYMGIVRIKRTHQLFPGVHQPIVSKSLFEAVQSVLKGKGKKRIYKHEYLFRRLLSCSNCKHTLTGERQKGVVYYRCHTQKCSVTCVREDVVDMAFSSRVPELEFSPNDDLLFEKALADYRKRWEAEKAALRSGIQLSLGKTRERLTRLTDVFLDGALDRETFESRKNDLVMEQKQLEENLLDLDSGRSDIPKKVAEYFELARTAFYNYHLATPDEKRNMLKSLTSNRTVHGKAVDFTWLLPFKILAESAKSTNGGPRRGSLRTLEELVALTSQSAAQPSEDLGLAR